MARNPAHASLEEALLAWHARTDRDALDLYSFLAHHMFGFSYEEFVRTKLPGERDFHGLRRLRGNVKQLLFMCSYGALSARGRYP